MEAQKHISDGPDYMLSFFYSWYTTLNTDIRVAAKVPEGTLLELKYKT